MEDDRMSEDENWSETHMPGQAGTWRLLSNLMDLWALCDRNACRRARACRGDSRACIPYCGPLVPEDAKEWAIELFECKRKGLSFDDARASLAPESEAAWMAWDEAVRRIVGRPWGRGRPP
jgi:hypothetical protein